MDARLILPLLLWTSSAAAAFDHAHPSWDALLKKHVVLLDGGKASQLRYADMARERTGLKAYLQTLSDVSEREFEAWSRAEQMAFLINAYNAFTVEKVLTRYPAIASIWDFGKLFGNPFRDRFFMLFGQPRSLDDRRARHPAQDLSRAAHPFRGELRLRRLPDAARGGLSGR